MFKTAIVGSGQLGSRHLQGIKTASLELSIEVVDSNLESLKNAENRYNEVGDNQYKKDVSFLSSLDDLSNELDLVIIATGSAPRFAITNELIKKKNVRNIVFEKVLFQNEKYYHNVNNLLKSNNIRAWVNCPRRMYDYYNTIREAFSKEDKIILNVSGGDWGLGCNSIHFIDIISYLTGQTEYSLLTNGLNKKIYASKRSGYVEFCGILTGFTKRGDIFNFISQENSSTTPIVSIVTQNQKFIIDEVKGYMASFSDNNWKSQIIQVPYQSQLTGNVVEAILLNKDIKLTKYEDSMKLHLPLISSLLDFYNAITGNDSINCPIT